MLSQCKKKKKKIKTHKERSHYVQELEAKKKIKDLSSQEITILEWKKNNNHISKTEWK